MLTLTDSDSLKEHDFVIDNEDIVNNKKVFQLASLTYPDFLLKFTLDIPLGTIYEGYSTTVHLFKNPHFTQGSVMEMRIDGLAPNNGRVGYFFRLDALFEPVLATTPHTYTYAYFAVKYLFTVGNVLQTKTPAISIDLSMKDFFDEDTILLVLCNEYTSVIPHFLIDNYLGQLFNVGFTYFDRDNPIDQLNTSTIIEQKFIDISAIRNGENLPVFRTSRANENVISEAFTIYIFKNLIQKKNEAVTRFVMLYQVIEILIQKVLVAEIGNEVCANLTTMTGFKLMEKIRALGTEKHRITALVHTYSTRDALLEQQLQTDLINFFTHVNDPDFMILEPNFSLVDYFYGYRNKLVHNYRLIHDPAIDLATTINLMENVNLTTEVFIANLISTFH